MPGPVTPAATGLYRDRRDAGRQLAATLGAVPAPVVVLGIPRGGVVVAAEVAAALHAPLDVIVARKIGAPGQGELAVGAVTADGTVVLNEEAVAMLGLSDSWLREAAAVERRAAQERERRLIAGRVHQALGGRHVILVDDGLATGATMRAAAGAVRRAGAARIIVAAPVGSVEACNAMRLAADAVVCPAERADFGAVGLWYQRFDQVHDAEVAALLQRAHAPV